CHVINTTTIYIYEELNFIRTEHVCLNPSCYKIQWFRYALK
ncbi:hypothetical protein C923_04732, partial [Plasmodium falciparum UGT5.1]